MTAPAKPGGPGGGNVAQFARDEGQMTLKQALQSAGIDPETRLREIEDRIVADKPGYEISLDLYYAQISGDAALLWECFKSVRQQVCADRLRAAMARRKDLGASVFMPSGHGLRAPKAGGARGQTLPAIHQKLAPRPSAALDFQQSRHAVTTIAKTIFDRFETPFGRMVGDITGSECKAWVTKSRRDAKVSAWLAARVPDNGMVRDHVTADELAAVVRAANKGNDDAE